MKGILPTFLDTKYNAIRAQERQLAKAVTKKVIKMPEVTIWAFMIPFIFFFNFLRYKRASETFALNFLFTKKLALDAALDITSQRQSRQDALESIDSKTQAILAEDKQGVYSENIRRKQLAEIDLLLDHYLKLLEAEGTGYETLIKNAYPTKRDYEAFLHKLGPAEKAVNHVAIQAIGATEATHDMVSKMEKAAQTLRIDQSGRIFTP